MEERRKIKRRYMLYYARIFEAQTQDLVGHLVDITTGGAMIISEKPMQGNTIFNLKLELSADVSDQPYLEFKARSVWCHPDIDPQYYNTGFQIVDLTPEGETIIRRIMEIYGFRDN